MTLCHAERRHHVRRGHRETWNSFVPQEPFRAGHPIQDRKVPPADSFGILEAFDEHRLAPGVSLPRRPRRAAEILTYVHEGTLAEEDSTGRSAVIHAGEFQCQTMGRSLHHGETNASRTENAHVFQIWLRLPEPDLPPGHEQKRFSAAERRGLLCMVASPAGQRGSLHTRPDAYLYSAILAPGQHVVHELAQGRGVWVHIVQGEATLMDTVLSGGDGAGVTDERAVSFTARQETEFLLLDLRIPPRAPQPATQSK